MQVYHGLRLLCAGADFFLIASIEERKERIAKEI